MKKFVWIFVLLGLSVLGLIGCTDTREEITDIEFLDVSFVYDGTPKSIFITGDLPDGVTVSYEGNGKVEVGIYTVTASFNVDTSKYFPLEDISAVLTILPIPSIEVKGVENNGVYFEPVKPEFNFGTAKISKDNSEEVEFLSGTIVSELGNYILVVTHEEETVTIAFSIEEEYEVFENQITDMFTSQLPHKNFIPDSNLDFSIQDEKLVLLNRTGGDPWGILKRQFLGVNATEFPYLEIDVDIVYPGDNVRLEVALLDDEWSTEPNLLTIQYHGLYYLNVLEYVKSKSMNETNADLYLKFAIVGKSAGYAGVELNHFRSIKELPVKEKADQYIDESIETLSLWRSNTAVLDIINDEAVGYVTNTVEPYGNFIKRVELNTIDYQELVIDIKSVEGNASWSIKFQVEGGPEVTLFEASSQGVFKVNLGNYNELKEQQNVIVMLIFYVIGDGEDDYVIINGFRTQYLEPVLDPLLIDEIKEDNWNVVEGSKIFEEGSLKVTKSETDAMAKFSKTFAIDIENYQYISFHFNLSYKLDDGFSINVIDQTKDGWPSYRYRGGNHIKVEELLDGIYYYNFLIDLSLHPVFETQEVTNLFFEITLEYGDSSKTIELLGVFYDEIGIIDSSVLDDFSIDNWTLALGSKEFKKGELSIIKNENEGMAKASTKYFVNTIEYTKIVFNFTSNFKLDDGFSINVIDQSKDGWPSYLYRGFSFVEQEIEEEAKFTYLYVLDLELQPSFLEQEKIELFFELVIEFGDAMKMVELKSIEYFDSQNLDDLLLDDFTNDDWNVAEGTKEFESGKLQITKSSAEPMAKLSKTFSIDMSTYKYISIHFNADFVVDEGFSVTLIDQGKPGWPSYKFQGDTYVEFVEDNEGVYEYVYLLDLSLHPGYDDKEIIDLFFEIVFEYGDIEKTIQLKRIAYHI